MLTKCTRGTVLVSGPTGEYYAVVDKAAGTQLASKQVNQPVYVPAGEYSVKLGNNMRSATVTAGQRVELNW